MSFEPDNHEVAAFVDGLISAAAANAMRGEHGGTCRPLPEPLVGCQRELIGYVQAAGVGYQLSEHLGHLALTVQNDQRAVHWQQHGQPPPRAAHQERQARRINARRSAREKRG